jgi:hypothetical protein
MRTHTIVHEKHSQIERRISTKSMRALMLVSVLLSLSFAVNAMIILLAGGGF